MTRFIIIGGMCLPALSSSAIADSPVPARPAPRTVIVEKVNPAVPRVEVIEVEKSAAPRVVIVDDSPDTLNMLRTVDGIIPAADQSANPANPGPAPVAARPSKIAWVEASYLLWQIKDGPLPIPLVTTGNPFDPVPGADGQPGTGVLFGRQDFDFRCFNGLRLSAGMWIDTEPVGGEISIFCLERKSKSFLAVSDGAGNPPLYLSAFNPVTGGEASLVVSDPALLFAGNVSVTMESRLRGLELNGLLAATACEWGEVNLLAGVRVLDLEESLILRNQTSDLATGTFTDLTDRFQTENQFYGCQVGGAIGYCSKYFASVTGKFAAGWTRSVVDVQGYVNQTAGAPGVPAGQFGSGFYAQSSNIGRRQEWGCAIVPEINLRAGCDLFGCVRAFVGYDCLYWSRVARPGDQIDRNLNLTQSPVFGAGALAGPAQPAPRHDTTDFFAHGFSAGIELHY